MTFLSSVFVLLLNCSLRQDIFRFLHPRSFAGKFETLATLLLLWLSSSGFLTYLQLDLQLFLVNQRVVYVFLNWLGHIVDLVNEIKHCFYQKYILTDFVEADRLGLYFNVLNEIFLRALHPIFTSGG